MTQILQDGENITLSKLEIRLLVAFLRGPMSLYEAAQQCQDDTRALKS